MKHDNFINECAERANRLSLEVDNGNVNFNQSLSHFIINHDEQDKLKLSLTIQGWSREDIIHKVHLDTYNDLINKGYEPALWLKEEIEGTVK